MLPTLLALLAGPSWAQEPPADLDRVQPALESWRLLTVEDARLPAQRGVAVRAWQVGAGGLLPDPAGVVLGAYTSLSGGWGNTRAGLSLPLYLTPRSGTLPALPGDLRAQARLLLVPGVPSQPGLALTLGVHLPSAGSALGLAPARPAGELGLVGDVDRGPWMVAANLGARFGAWDGTLTWEDQLHARLGLAAGPWPWLDGVLELHAAAPLSSLREASALPWSGEALLGVRVGTLGGLELRAYGGRGLGDAAGAPTWRGAVGVAWARWGEPDPDRDGLAGAADRCPDLAEDADGFEDQDGCPELDNDGDRVPDLEDACPEVPEDRDGTLDGDGCADGEALLQLRVELPAPWPAQAQVRLSSTATAVDRPPDTLLAGRTVVDLPLSAGEWRLEVRAPGYQEHSALLQVPGEGALAYTARLEPLDAPQEVELRVLDAQGRPVEAVALAADRRWPFSGGVGVIRLPPGPQSLEVEAPAHRPVKLTLDGLPGEQVQRTVRLALAEPVTVQGGQPVLHAPIVFGPGLALPAGASREVLDALARLLLAHPELGVVRVEAHCAALGEDAADLALSQRMAEAVVEALVARGVPRERLEPMGFGSTAGQVQPGGQGVTLFAGGR